MKTERSKYKPHSIPVTNEEIDKGLTEYFLTHSVLTRRDFEQLFTLTRATAGRYITRLAKEKKLCNISIPHNPIYEPMPGFYGKEKLPEPNRKRILQQNENTLKIFIKSKFYKQFQTYDKKLKLLHQTEGFPGGNPSAVSIYGHLCAEAFSLLSRYLHPAPAIAGFYYLYLCRYPFRHFRHV